MKLNSAARKGIYLKKALLQLCVLIHVVGTYMAPLLEERDTNEKSASFSGAPVIVLGTNNQIMINPRTPNDASEKGQP